MILCHEFPVFKKRSPKKIILFGKLPQLPTNMERVLKISYVMTICVLVVVYNVLW